MKDFTWLRPEVTELAFWFKKNRFAPSLLSSFLKDIPNSKDLMQERKKESVDSMVAERLHFHYS